jgi:hypothetical protein
MYNELCKSISKIAVAVEGTCDGKDFFYVITQNPEVISFFDASKVGSFYQNNDEIQRMSVYEVTLNKLIGLDFSDIKYIHWIGIPHEIPPPSYLLPQLEGYTTNEQLFNFQKPFLEKIRHDRDRECYSDKVVPLNTQLEMSTIHSYLLPLIEKSNNKHPLSHFFDDWVHYGEFNRKRNIKDTSALSELYKSMFFIPVIQACLGKELSIEEDFEKFLDKSIFIGLKEKWVSFIKERREQTIKDKKEELINLDNEHRKKLSTLIKNGLNQAFIQIYTTQLPENYEITTTAWDNFKKTEGLHVEDNDRYSYKTILVELGVPNDSMDKLLEVVTGESTKEQKQFTEIVDAFKAEVDSVIFEYKQLETQYELLLSKLEILNVGEDLKEFNDYRIFLRYWPESFDIDATFHQSIRPFTDTEWHVLRFFFREKIEFDLDMIYKSDFDYYNSVIDILEIYNDRVREKMLSYIEKIALVRKTEIEKEMSDVELTDEEKVQFQEILTDITDIEKYKKELNSEKNLLNILAYWPVALYPVPEDILQL